MAIIITGGMVSQASGRLGGTIFSRNRGGAYVRNGSIPTTVTTPAAQQIKALTAFISRLWASFDKDTQEQWREWATQNPVINRLGQSRTLSGHQAFVKLGVRLMYAGFAPIDSPPVSAAPVAPTIGAISAVGATGVITVAFTPTPMAALLAVQAYAYLSNSPGVAYVKNRLALVFTTAAAAATPVTLTNPVADRFGPPQTGQTLHLGLRVIDSTSGLVSATFYASHVVT